MAKKKDGVNKSEEIRKLLSTNPNMSVKDIREALAAKGIKVADNLIYFIKGKVKGRTGRRKKAQKMVASVKAVNGDPVATILKIKHFASELGGMKKLKALVDALSE
jgi:hypothetical protein